MGTSALSFVPSFVVKRGKFSVSKWLMKQRSSTSATSTTGMAKARSTSSSSETSYALGMNITKKACVAQGQTDEEGKKFAKYDDVVEKVKAAVATPDSQGGYNDY